MIHGYVTAPPYRTFTTLNEPDAGTSANQGTFATSINLEGEIAGNYTDASGVYSRLRDRPALYHLHLIRGRPRRETQQCQQSPAELAAAMSSVSKAITEQRNTSNAFKGLHHDHSLQINSGGVMNRLQLWNVVSVVLLACGLASAQTITAFSAPGAGTGAGQGTGGFGINPQGTVVGSYLDDGNVFHGYQCVSGCGSASTFTTFNAPGAGKAANQGTITFGINVFGVITGYFIDANNVAHGFVTTAPFKHFTILNEPDAGKGAGQGTYRGQHQARGRGDRRILR